METENISTETTEKKARKTNTMPVKQSVILDLAESIVKKWENNQDITLRWIKFEDFKTLTQEFRLSLEQRIRAGSGRQSKTKQLKNLDVTINKVTEELKIAILGKFGKEDGKSYFTEFGITKVSKAFKLPNERTQRQQALATLVQGIEKHQLSVRNYSLENFKEIQSQYNALINEAKDIDSSVSAEVGTKNELIKQVEKVLNALIWAIKANFPDTYQAELRAWGFQKEKY
jgi:D-ribose pyranose/furanose isomerase RbsD